MASPVSVPSVARGAAAPGADHADRTSARRALLAVLLLFAVLTLPYLIWPLNPHPDERRYTFAAAQMIETGNYLVPVTETGATRLVKPPLTYYYVVAGFRTLGETLAGAKALMVLSALASIALTYVLARSLGATRAASVLAAAMLAGHRIYFGTANLHIPDMPLVLGTTLALVGAVRLLQPPRNGTQGAAWPWYALFLGLAFAVQAKGMLPLLLLAIFAVLVAMPGGVARSAGAPGGRGHALVAACLGLVLGGGWFLGMWLTHPDELVAQFLGDQVTRKAGFDPLVVLAGMGKTASDLVLPFLPALVGLALVWRRRGRAAGPADRRRAVWMLVLWCLVSVVLFAFSVKLYERYILPAAPAFAALCALAASRLPPDLLATGLRRSGRVLLLLPAALGLLGAAVAFRVGQPGVAALAALATLFVTVALMRLAGRRQPWGAILVIASVAPLMDTARLPIYPALVFPSVGQHALAFEAGHRDMPAGRRLVLDDPKLLDEIGLLTGGIARLDFSREFDPAGVGDAERVYFLDPAHRQPLEAMGFAVVSFPILRELDFDDDDLLNTLREGTRDEVLARRGEQFFIAARPGTGG